MPEQISWLSSLKSNSVYVFLFTYPSKRIPSFFRVLEIWTTACIVDVKQMELQSMKSRPWLSKEKKECDIKRDHLKALKQDNWLLNFTKLLFLLRSAWPLIQILPISTLTPSSFLCWDPTLYLLFNLFFLSFILRL